MHVVSVKVQYYVTPPLNYSLSLSNTFTDHNIIMIICIKAIAISSNKRYSIAGISRMAIRLWPRTQKVVLLQFSVLWKGIFYPSYRCFSAFSASRCLSYRFVHLPSCHINHVIDSRLTMHEWVYIVICVVLSVCNFGCGGTMVTRISQARVY